MILNIQSQFVLISRKNRELKTLFLWFHEKKTWFWLKRLILFFFQEKNREFDYKDYLFWFHEFREFEYFLLCMSYRIRDEGFDLQPCLTTRIWTTWPPTKDPREHPTTPTTTCMFWIWVYNWFCRKRKKKNEKIVRSGVL